MNKNVGLAWRWRLVLQTRDIMALGNIRLQKQVQDTKIFLSSSQKIRKYLELLLCLLHPLFSCFVSSSSIFCKSSRHLSVHHFDRHLLVGAAWFTCCEPLDGGKTASVVFCAFPLWLTTVATIFSCRRIRPGVSAPISPLLSSPPSTSRRSFLRLLPPLCLHLLPAAAPSPCNCYNCSVQKCVCVCVCVYSRCHST